ncbi:MAG: Flp family type IVb pilin [Fusobacteria bacterium]|nr:Flp family type IVb pilin [Fusobacteriota bacterium]
MKKFLGWLTKEESGQGMVEYGLIIVLVAIVVIIALTALGGALTGIFERITTELNK